jgi:hypothetical protein
MNSRRGLGHRTEQGALALDANITEYILKDMASQGVADFKLQISAAAKEDIDELCGEDDELYDTLWMYLKELSTDQVLLEKLLEDRYGKLRHGDRFSRYPSKRYVGLEILGCREQRGKASLRLHVLTSPTVVHSARRGTKGLELCSFTSFLGPDPSRLRSVQA